MVERGGWTELGINMEELKASFCCLDFGVKWKSVVGLRLLK